MGSVLLATESLCRVRCDDALLALYGMWEERATKKKLMECHGAYWQARLLVQLPLVPLCTVVGSPVSAA